MRVMERRTEEEVGHHNKNVLSEPTLTLSPHTAQSPLRSSVSVCVPPLRLHL